LVQDARRGPGRGRQLVLLAAALVVAVAGAGMSHVDAAARLDRPLAQPAAKRGPAGRIKHVIVFYQENHSFDEVLGEFCRRNNHRCDGHVGKVKLEDGTTVQMHKAPDIVPPVWHNVAAQQTAMNGGRMNGWDRVSGCEAPQRNCLEYYTPKQIPNYTQLAGEYTVNDRTFSMYDSPSYGGHIYVAAASQDDFTGDTPDDVPGVTPGPGWGCDSKLVAPWRDPVTKQVSVEPTCIPARAGQLDKRKFPYNGAFRATRVQHIPTIFDRLDAKHVPWKIYTSIAIWSVCPYFAECLYGPQAKHMVSPYQIIDDARNSRLPAFALLLPGGREGTSQHNRSSMRAGDNWIGQILGELQRSPEWSSTAVFITYDDCGCFYDHVRPGTNPDGSMQGIRLPMVIAGGYAKRGFTDHHPATLAGILKFTEEAYGLTSLGVNDAEAYDYADAFDFTRPPRTGLAQMRQHPLPAASRRYLAAHPQKTDDAT
jgi:phospholipase C